MSTKARTESSVEPELETDVKEEQGSPDSSKTSQKKKKTPTARRRTKTGCLTCRQRRVKCDEMKPTCRNCEKSRRTCAGYQVPQARPPSASDQFFVPQPHPSPPYNGPHSAIDPASAMYTGTAATTPDYVQNISPTEYSSTYIPTIQQQPQQPYEYPLLNANINTAYHQYPPAPDWHHPQMHQPQAYPYNMHHPVNFDSSSRAVHGNITSFRNSNTIPRPLAAPQAVPTHNPIKVEPHDDPYIISVEEDPNDPWDVDSEDDFSEHSSLINHQMPRNVMLDERMAYLLTHFVTVLRPCMSIYERPLMYDGTATFAEKLPMLALSNRGLLHGLLAMSSLQLAIMHHTSEAVPLKHFVIASKKLAKLISEPSSRHKLETLGLCLILAFYEVLLGDHARWTLHLRGAAAFVMEHDFAGFARAVRSLRARARSQTLRSNPVHYGQVQIPSALLSDEEWDVDESLISQFTGLDIDYAQQMQPSAKSFVSEHDLTQDTVHDWRTKLDLMWWYVKMDVFQSMLSGDSLLLPYQDWKFLVPRGKIGSAANLHATMDHLWLILGRLADFGAKDRARKLRKMATMGGAWVPESGFMNPPATMSETSQAGDTMRSQQSASRVNDPRANEGRTRAPKVVLQMPKAKKPPLFFGMMPPPKIPPSMLSSFHITDTELRAGKLSSPIDPMPTSLDLTSATEAALKEHDSIKTAFSVWIDALAPEFAPLPQRSSSGQSLFGPIKRYRDPIMACIWAMYHLGKILLRRYHPYSPPAMMMSASVNQAFTRADAEAVACINVGLLESQAELANEGSINPTLVAALQEVTFPLMFAGVQFQDPTQRSWMIDNLLDLAKYSGWRTAISVASGLESAWHAQGGYQRILHVHYPDEANKYDPNLSHSRSGQAAEDVHHSRFVKHDRRLIDRFSDLRAFWAVGLLSSQEDLQDMIHRLDINDSK